MVFCSNEDKKNWFWNLLTFNTTQPFLYIVVKNLSFCSCRAEKCCNHLAVKNENGLIENRSTKNEKRCLIVKLTSLSSIYWIQRTFCTDKNELCFNSKSPHMGFELPVVFRLSHNMKLYPFPTFLAWTEKNVRDLLSF